MVFAVEAERPAPKPNVPQGRPSGWDVTRLLFAVPLRSRLEQALSRRPGAMTSDARGHPENKRGKEQT
jgi:hypothetical protein